MAGSFVAGEDGKCLENRRDVNARIFKIYFKRSSYSENGRCIIFQDLVKFHSSEHRYIQISYLDSKCNGTTFVIKENGPQ